MTMKRESNIELLRILSMISIVLNHMSGHGGLSDKCEGVNKYLAVLFACNGKLGVCIFVLIGSMFLVKKHAKVNSIVNIWLKTFIASSLCGIGQFILYHQKKELLQSFFPVIFTRYWFVTVYLALLILTPWLNLFIHKLSREDYKKLIIVLSVICCIIPTITGMKDYFTNQFVWFLYLYLLMGYRELHIEQSKVKNIYKIGVILVINYLIIYVVYYITGKSFIRNSGSVFLLICSLCFIEIFRRIRITNLRVCKFINSISRVTFMVYLFHDSPLRDILWNKIIRCDRWCNSRLFLLYVFGSVVFIFAISYICDKVFMKIIAGIQRIGIVNRIIERMKIEYDTIGIK